MWLDITDRHDPLGLWTGKGFILYSIRAGRIVTAGFKGVQGIIQGVPVIQTVLISLARASNRAMRCIVSGFGVFYSGLSHSPLTISHLLRITFSRISISNKLDEVALHSTNLQSFRTPHLPLRLCQGPVCFPLDSHLCSGR